MATRDYFVKVSWRDSNQPLRYVRSNGRVSVDLTLDEWDVVGSIKSQTLGRGMDVDEFVVDFMIEIPNED
jgi:hypothetical protein